MINIGNLYNQSKVTLREAARFFSVDVIEERNIFLHVGRKGTHDASNVMVSLKRFES